MLAVVDSSDSHLTRGIEQRVSDPDEACGNQSVRGVDPRVRGQAGEVLGSRRGAPLARALVVFLQHRLGEDLLVLRITEQVAHLAAKADGKFGVVRGLNDLQLRIPAEEPCWHKVRGELGL